MHVLFEDRREAGKRLAKRLSEYHETESILLGIPRGGIPVAAAAAHRLLLPWNVVVVRKLPIPWNPEAGFGAIAADGSVVLNEQLVHALDIDESQMDEVVKKVGDEVRRRSKVYSRERPPANLRGKNAIVIDDGVASGYTMLAAIKSCCAQGAASVIAASPVASRSAAAMLESVADKCVFDIVSPAVPFAVADFYVEWHDLTDEDILPILKTDRL